MVAFPAQVTTATVNAVLTSAVVDSTDADLLPDAVPLVGQVTFTPDKVNGQLLVPTATPPLMVTVKPMPFLLAADGSLSANLVVIPGATYTVSFALNGVRIAPFSIGPLVAGTTYDLASLAPVTALNGAQLTKGDPGAPGAPGVNGWAPLTAYAAGQPVLSPTGDVVSAKVAFTSGAAYSAANWNVVATTPGTATRTALDAAFAPLPVTTDAVLYVAPSGNDAGAQAGRSPGNAFRTLTAAVAALPAGLSTPATISIAPGAYTEPGTINLGQRKNLSIIGAGMGVTTLTFSGTGSSIVSAWPINSASTPTLLTLRDFTIANANVANVAAGFEQRCGALVYVTSVGISGHKYGIIFDQTAHGHIDKCNLQQQITGGIWLTRGGDWTAGASVTPPFTDNITITRNQINEPATCVGIIDDGGWTHAIKDNSLNGCSNQIIVAAVSGGVIANNECENGSDHYLLLTGATYKSSTAISGSAGLVVTGNTIDTASTGKAAIMFTAGEAVTLLANSLSSTGFAVRGQSTVTTLTSIGNFQNGTGALHESISATHVALDGVKAANLNLHGGKIMSDAVTGSDTVQVDLGNGVLDGGGVPSYGVGRGNPASRGTIDVRGGTADTTAHGIRNMVNGTSALELLGNGAGSQLKISEARDIVLGTVTGTKIGTSAGQKLGFFGMAPVTQRGGYGISNPTALRALDGSATSANTLADVIQVLGRLITDIKATGLLA